MSAEVMMGAVMPDTATGKDLDRLAEHFGVFNRRIIDDGREPDWMTGLPLETDAELRARVKAALMGDPTDNPDEGPYR